MNTISCIKVNSTISDFIRVIVANLLFFSRPDHFGFQCSRTCSCKRFNHLILRSDGLISMALQQKMEAGLKKVYSHQGQGDSPAAETHPIETIQDIHFLALNEGIHLTKTARVRPENFLEQFFNAAKGNRCIFSRQVSLLPCGFLLGQIGPASTRSQQPFSSRKSLLKL